MACQLDGRELATPGGPAAPRGLVALSRIHRVHSESCSRSLQIAEDIDEDEQPWIK